MDHSSSVDTDVIRVFEDDGIIDRVPPFICITAFESIIQHLYVKGQEIRLHVVPFVSFCIFLFIIGFKIGVFMARNECFIMSEVETRG